MSAAVCALLTESANFREVVELRPCDALHPLVEMRITSWYLDAKDPESAQVRFQALVAPEALSGLRNALEAVLACRGACLEQEGQ